MPTHEIPNDKREFHCNHCNGKILIPRDLPPTTGPCPHCSGVITSPAPEAAATEHPHMPPAPPASVQAVQPAPPPAVKIPERKSVSPPTPEPPKRVPPPAVKPLPSSAAPSVLPPAPAVEEKPAVEIPHAENPSHGNKRKTKPALEKNEPRPKSALVPVMLILLLLFVGAGTAVIFVTKEMGRDVPPPAPMPGSGGDSTAMEANYIRVGWQKDAYQVLEGYMAGTTGEEKLPFILNGDALAGKIEDFYGGGVINDSDTPADAFSVYELSEEDRKRGLFMMIYDQPPQFEMKEFFRPLASLEVQYGVDEADLLLSTLARVGNFAMEPLRVHAFFKRTPQGLKLDWEIFAQTKYRTFQNFVELPEPGQSGIFRIFVVEDVPDKGRLEAGTRTYRLADPANTGDSARVNVKVDSETGRTLSIINWRGAKEGKPITKTATVELTWAGEENAPKLEISRFICWEFVGLGGKEAPATASSR